MATVYVASRLPFGYIMEHPTDGRKIELAGIHRDGSGAIAVPYGETEVDKDFWESWSKHNKDFAALKNGVIFAQANQKELAAMAKDAEKERTGLEPASQDAPGIKPADSK